MSAQQFIYIPVRSEEEMEEDPRYAPIPLSGSPKEVYTSRLGIRDPDFRFESCLCPVCQTHYPRHCNFCMKDGTPLDLVKNSDTIGFPNPMMWQEDRGHDWHYSKDESKLYYHPGGERDGGIWVVVVYED